MQTLDRLEPLKTVDVLRELRIHGLRRRAGAQSPHAKVWIGLQLNCQDFSATVTNPGLIPVDTNANLRR